MPKSAPTPVINVPCELTIYAIDRYGNSITNGGHRVECKASGAATTPCTIEDNHNGTYTVSFSAGVPGEVKVVARVESMEIGPPLVLNFIRPEPKADAKAMQRPMQRPSLKAIAIPGAPRPSHQNLP